MAKTKAQSTKPSSDPTADTEARVIYYDELHFIKTSEKTPYWAAQVLYFNKMVGEPFVTTKEVNFYRDLEEGKINEKLYREFIDPIGPDGKGGDAAYFKANWQTCPIYMHLENIKEAQLKKLPLNIVVKAADELSKQKQQEENDKIIGANYMRDFMNEIGPQFGIRTLKPDEDPFTFISQMEQAQQQQQGQPQAGANPTTALDGLKAKISTNSQLAIYNQYLFKSGVEASIEIAIDQYLEAINKFKQGILPKIIADQKNFNAHMVRYYTSETTGRPVTEYQEPHYLRVSPFSKPDTSDKTFVIKEYDVSFGQFVQMAGAELDPATLKEIFIKNRAYHGLNRDYEKLTTFQRNSARIRIGYHEFETQNMDVYADYVSKYGNKVFKQVDEDYKPADWAVKKLGAQRVEKHYNVWYSHYYIPLDTLFEIHGTTSFTQQAKYIFKFGPIQDQVREGDDFKYSKGTFFGNKTKRFSFAKIEHSFMPEIIKLWQLFQNDLSNSMSDGAQWSERALNNMLKYIDAAPGASPAQKKMQALRFIRQTNSLIADSLVESGSGKMEEPLFKKIENNSLDTAAKRLVMIGSLYQLLTKSLGFNEIAEGESPKPRQNLGGINLSLMASSNASYHMEEAITNTYVNLSEGLMYYIKEICDEGDSQRYKEFKEMVGDANAMAAQSIKDIPLHKLNLHLENQMTDEIKKDIIDTATEMAKAGILSPDQVLFLKMIDNVKYAYAYLSIEIQAGQIAIAQSQQDARQQTRSDQLFTSGLKVREMHALKADDAFVEKMLLDIKGQQMVIDNKLKFHGQAVIKDIINNHRTQQAIIDNRLQLNTLRSTQAMESHAAKTA